MDREGGWTGEGWQDSKKFNGTGLILSTIVGPLLPLCAFSGYNFPLSLCMAI